MIALKLNRWPMVDYVKQAEQEQQEKVNRLYPKKNDIILSGHIYDGDRSQFPHQDLAII